MVCAWDEIQVAAMVVMMVLRSDCWLVERKVQALVFHSGFQKVEKSGELLGELLVAR
jgi:hypothetical protein